MSLLFSDVTCSVTDGITPCNNVSGVVRRGEENNPSHIFLLSQYVVLTELTV